MVSQGASLHFVAYFFEPDLAYTGSTAVVWRVFVSKKHPWSMESAVQKISRKVWWYFGWAPSAAPGELFSEAIWPNKKPIMFFSKTVSWFHTFQTLSVKIQTRSVNAADVLVSNLSWGLRSIFPRWSPSGTLSSSSSSLLVLSTVATSMFFMS